MNHAVTLGVKKTDGKLTFAVISDPNVPHNVQRRAFRQARRDLFGQYDEVQLWTSSAGRVKRQSTTDAQMPNQPVKPAVETPLKSESVPQPEPVIEPQVEQSVEDLLSTGAEPAQVGTETQAGATNPPVPVSSAGPDKRTAALAKARAAAAAKKAAKAKR